MKILNLHKLNARRTIATGHENAIGDILEFLRQPRGETSVANGSWDSLKKEARKGVLAEFDGKPMAGANGRLAELAIAEMESRTAEAAKYFRMLADAIENGEAVTFKVTIPRK